MGAARSGLVAGRREQIAAAADGADNRRLGRVRLDFAPDSHDPEVHRAIEGFAVAGVRELQQPLCGTRRPGHFAGVATIVTKLFHLTKPHVAVFGEKDYQQLAIIRRMVRDLDFDIEIASVPIVREPDGLAMSSRNAYLSAEQRTSALALSRGLAAAEAAVTSGERDAASIVAAARAELDAAQLRIDYAELRDAVELTEVVTLAKPCVLALAAFVGTTRLIDNRVLAP